MVLMVLGEKVNFMNVLDLLEQYGITPRLATKGKSGPEFWSPCPGCGGDDRFHVWPDEKKNGAYWCRQCGKWGDDVQFRVDFMGMQYPEAFDAAGREKPLNYQRPKPRQKKPEFQPTVIADPDGAWQIRAAKLVDESHAALLDSPKGLAWLADRANRGINLESVKRFKLGAVSGENGRNCRYRSRRAWGLPEILRDDGRPKALWIPRGLLIPHIVDGRVQRIRIRRPDVDVQSKKDIRYYVLPGSAMAPMCIGTDQRAAAVVEAELDAILVAQEAGDLVTAVALGSSSARPDRVTWSVLQRALCVLVSMDFDVAGAKAWQWWQEQFPRACRWPVPSGKDPGEAYAAGVDIHAWIKAGLPPACRIGRLILNGDDKKGAKVDKADRVSENGLEKIEPKKHDTADRAEPDSIRVLYNLLRRYPEIRIRATAERTTLLHTVRVKDNILQQISRLMFFDQACSDFLHRHPADVVNAANFYRTGGRS